MKRTNEVIVGVFVTLTILIGIAGTLWLARRGFSKSYPVYAQFPWGANLKTGQQVLLAGVQVGYVDDVDLDSTGYLDVKMSIDKGRRIPQGTTATVVAVGFFGDQSIALTPCPPRQHRAPGDTALNHPVADAGAARRPPRPACRVSGYFEPGDTIPTGVGSPSMTELLTRVDSVSGALSDVTRTIQFQMVQQGGIADLRQTIASTNSLVKQLNGIATDQSRGLALTLKSLRRSVSAIDSASIDSTLNGLQATANNLAALTGNLQGATGTLNKVMAKLETGDGTAARLLNDPGIYNDLRLLLARLDSLTADIKTNPKRYINVKVF
jgi:phospholipid/cholesterol/gamma-HCH transport system substrate-binding protein